MYLSSPFTVDPALDTPETVMGFSDLEKAMEAACGG